MSQHEVTLLLGSNVGNTENNIKTAIRLLEAKIGTIIARTEMITTEPVEFDSNNFFCNIAIVIKTQYSPISLLKQLKAVERLMGRSTDTSVSKIYEDRIIDIDVIFFDKISFYSTELIIPHEKHLHQREFSRRLLDELMNIKKQ
ncbi:2-amino-4-hydroxy-6-hydroxymethyldihydropteridine pyrophosphokinase [Kaistella solincola]|uniref:2-amino-4-hydroxy-6-hydroxymethyldihydropteridine pyrophosphokinase n=1 Tax=Kaistella solincola TaxID=510955 RepID=A0ABR4ZU84_9FLAO|nr:2-amino-4-hydroxy-6-hydroxymethyldihydropteridine diphosphokinase [Kaistella solincola]KIA84224.1 2-amino-4-hydroxy-6-hydroxymethyldihydropteridine pyrophosphokinase [Kaistella solincola]